MSKKLFSNIEIKTLSNNKHVKSVSERGITYTDVFKRKPKYVKGKCHKKFDNFLNRDFKASTANEKWCTDFTYLKLANGSKRYNCSILDLYDRSIVATLNGKEITAELAINTLKIALQNNPKHYELILHSGQGSQFISKEFTDFCS